MKYLMCTTRILYVYYKYAVYYSALPELGLQDFLLKYIQIEGKK